MGINLKNRKLITYLSVLCLFLLIFVPIGTFAQLNSTDNAATPTSQPYPLRGLYHLLYTDSTNSINATRLSSIYAYNIIGNELTSIDVNSGKVKTKSLDSSLVEDLNRNFSHLKLPDNLGRIDGPPCPECPQYGLTVYYIDEEKGIPITANAFWDAGTKGTEDLTKFTKGLVELAK